MKKLGVSVVLAALLLVPSVVFADPGANQAQIEHMVRHQILMLPYYGIFDDISFQVTGDTVTLEGAVHWPTLRSEAEHVVSRIEGVHKVVNNLEVLPVSSFDNQIRWAVARSVYFYPALQRYAQGAHPSIHIIVKNGNVQLDGVVDNTMDSQVAYMRALSVPNTFSVTNNLRVENPRH